MAATFKEAQENLLISLSGDLIDAETFELLYDVNTSSNLDLPYEAYEKFDLDLLCDDECKSQFHFYKNYIYKLQEVLRVPESIVCNNRVKIDGTEALCMFLKRFAYPCRYLDMVPRFARPIPQICMTTNNIMEHIYTNFGH